MSHHYFEMHAGNLELASDFDQFAEKTLELGGEAALPKFAIPKTCWQGYFTDTEGNTFGFFEVDENVG